MGYEVKIYVGEKVDEMSQDGAAYFMVAGMFDVCKPGYDSKLYELSADISDDEKFPLVRSYLRSGDQCDLTDCYDKKLRALPIQLVLDAAKADAATDEFRRFPIAVEFLESFVRHYKSDRLVAVLYGY